METRTIAVDFGKVDIYSKIEAGLAGLEIGVLGKRTPRSFILLFLLVSTSFKKTKQTRCTVGRWKFKKKRLEGVVTYSTPLRLEGVGMYGTAGVGGCRDVQNRAQFGL